MSTSTERHKALFWLIMFNISHGYILTDSCYCIFMIVIFVSIPVHVHCMENIHIGKVCGDKMVSKL